MTNANRHRFKLIMGIMFLLSLLTAPSSMYGETADKESESNLPNKAEMILTIEEELISLNAKDASLKEIIEEIGSKMEFEVVGSIDSEEKITLIFANLSIEDALKKLTTSYGYVMDAESEGKNITKIIVLPKGRKTAPSSSTTNESEPREKKKRPEPFKFEFNP